MLYISEVVLNCSLIISLLSAVQHVTLLSIKSLTHFSFSENRITDEAVDRLKTIIVNNPRLQELRLNNVSLKSDGLVIICQSIAKLNNLKVLSLTDNMISETAAPALANVIVNNTGIEKLYLDNNYLGTDGIACVINTLIELVHLKVLRFKNNKFQCVKVTEKLCRAISNNPCLENICFDGNQLCFTGMKELANVFTHKAQLKVLGVSSCGITKEAASHIADIIDSTTKLAKLQICDNSLTAEGCNVVAVKLKAITTLTKLYISNNNITEQAADGIAEVINNNSSLQVLDVGNNLLLTAGIVKIMKALSNLHQVKELWINNNHVTEEAANEIAAAIIHNVKLEKVQLDNNLLKTIGVCIICQALMQISSLKVLLIGNNNIHQYAANDLAAVITRNPLIETLELGNNKLESSGAIKIAAAFRQVYHLKVLGLENNQITSEAAGDIATAIGGNHGLEKLWLQNNKFDSKGIQIICNALMYINRLKIFQIDQKGSKTFGAISSVIGKHHFSIETLCISECFIATSIMDKLTSNLKQLHSLKRIKFNDNCFEEEVTGNMAAIIANSFELERLWLYSNALGDSYTTKIMNTVINRIMVLRVLHLGNNNITESSASDIAELIASNPFLECVHLGNNRLKASGVNKLVCSFKNLYNLRELELNSNHLDENAAGDIASMIAGKTRVEKLWINHNRLKATGVTVCYHTALYSRVQYQHHTSVLSYSTV